MNASILIARARAAWPLMFKSRFRDLQIENFTLRSALREAHNELRKHRTLIAALRTGQVDATLMLERVLKTPPGG